MDGPRYGWGRPVAYVGETHGAREKDRKVIATPRFCGNFRRLRPAPKSEEGKVGMSVRRRTWKTPNGETKEAWVVWYSDQHGKPHIKTFGRKKDADAYHASVTVEVREGRHTPDSDSITVAEAGKYWVATAEANSLERTTVEHYQYLLDAHIVPIIGKVKLSRMTTATVKDFRSRLLEDGRSPSMVTRVARALSMLLADAQEAGHVAQNVCRSLRKKKRSKAQQRRRLKAGVDIPTPAEVRAIVGKLEGRWRPLLLTALFTGLRASELRGLRWENVDLDAGELHVRERADRYKAFAAPKSEAGERTVPLIPMVAAELRKWKLACPKGPLGLVFPSGAGQVEFLANIIDRGWKPAQIAAGVCTIEKDANGKVIVDHHGEPVRKARYTGLHATRHFFASWCINRKADGGRELPAKVVQQWLGHSNIAMTLDIYGHLFPRGDDKDELAAAERAILG
jgi:integrase